MLLGTATSSLSKHQSLMRKKDKSKKKLKGNAAGRVRNLGSQCSEPFVNRLYITPILMASSGS
jgi:hypothetical protein